jgi:hypothetical protein
MLIIVFLKNEKGHPVSKPSFIEQCKIDINSLATLGRQTENLSFSQSHFQYLIVASWVGVGDILFHRLGGR